MINAINLIGRDSPLFERLYGLITNGSSRVLGGYCARIISLRSILLSTFILFCEHNEAAI
jgi:hypothetical protein